MDFCPQWHSIHMHILNFSEWSITLYVTYVCNTFRPKIIEKVASTTNVHDVAQWVTYVGVCTSDMHRHNWLWE